MRGGVAMCEKTIDLIGCASVRFLLGGRGSSISHRD